MVTDIRYSIVVFGQFEDITPSIEIIKQFSDLMAKYKLESGVAMEAEITPQGLRQFNGLRLSTNDGSMIVEFKRESMEISCINADINVTDVCDYNTFQAFVDNVILRDVLKNKRFKRIGFIHHVIIEGINHSEVAKRIVQIPIYSNLKMRDDWKIIWPAMTSLDDGTFVNAHTTIQRGRRHIIRDTQKEKLDGIDLIVDINTLKENTEYRYSNTTLREMCEKLYKKETEVRESITDIITK